MWEANKEHILRFPGYCVRIGDSAVSRQTSAIPENITGMRSVWRWRTKGDGWWEQIGGKARERIEAFKGSHRRLQMSVSSR